MNNLNKFISKRFSSEEKFGLSLTIGALITIFFTWFFYVVLEDVLSQEALFHSDVRIINLLALYRTSNLNKVMLAITYLGKWQIILLGVLFCVIIFALQKKWLYLWTLIISVAGGQIIVTIIKDVFHRARPPLENALYIENSYSFPSGHSLVAITFYGFLILLLYKNLKSKLARVFTIISGLILIGLIGFSRIYLGVHFPSDVLTGFLIGLAWVTVLITSISIINFNESTKILNSSKRKEIFWVGMIFIFAWLSVWLYYTYTHPLVEFPPKTTVVNLTNDQIPSALFVTLPKTSETLTGRPMEPINIIVIGNKDKLDQAFVSAGWSKTDSITVNSSFRIAFDSIFRKPYPKAPGTPSFWDYQPNEFAYEKAIGNSPNQRFHIHFWATNFQVNDIPVWFATAHFDKSIVFRDYIVPTHEIDPNIDTERAKVLNDLESTGLIAKNQEFQLVPPLTGKNAAGSLFFTDGKAEIIYLK